MTRITEVLLVPHAHHDVGYTHSPRIIRPLHEEAVREAIHLAGEPSADDRASFRWTLENARPLVEFLRHAGSDEVVALRALVRDGRISVTGGYLNSTQLVGHEELIRSFAWVDRFRGLGLPVRVVQHSDINGLPWGTVPAMVRAGLDVLVMALNPNHGRPPFEQPSAFWWEGPDGSRILVWLSLHYGLAEMWGLLDGEIDRFAFELASVVARIEARDDYPFDFVVLHATDDNGWPTRHAADGVRNWNELHPELPMATATIDAAMDRARAQAARGSLPVWRGEWADWWAHGHGSSAYEVGVSRKARSLVRAAETAAVLLRLEDRPQPRTERRTAWRRDPVRLPSELELGAQIDGVWDDLLLFDEHTWGADESVSRPDSAFTRSHWNAKAGLAFAAHDAARELALEGLLRLAAPGPVGTERSVVVFNPHTDARSGSVPIDIDGTSVDVVVSEVAGLGLVAVPLPLADPVTTEESAVLETARFRVEVDPSRGGVVSLVDRVLDWDLVDQGATEPLGALVVERVDATTDHLVVRESRQHFSPATPGPAFERIVARGTGSPFVERGTAWSAITWTVSAPTLPIVRVRLAIHDGLEAIDLSISLIKEERIDVEGIYVAFPFALREPTFWLETAGAVYRADVDQLPETCRDWYSIQHAAGVSDGRRSVVWTTQEAPLVQLGSIHTGQWAQSLDAPVGHLYAWLMNNLYFTNFKASQGGAMSFAFGIEPRSGPLDADTVRRSGERVALPLLGRVIAGAVADRPALLRVESPDITAVALALDPDGRAVRARLQASSHGAGSVAILWAGQRALVAWHSDVFGNRAERLAGDGHTFQLALGPDELATIVVAPLIGDAGADHG